jgi:hypothetical protein
MAKRSDDEEEEARQRPDGENEAEVGVGGERPEASHSGIFAGGWPRIRSSAICGA